MHRYLCVTICIYLQYNCNFVPKKCSIFSFQLFSFSKLHSVALYNTAKVSFVLFVYTYISTSVVVRIQEVKFILVYVWYPGCTQSFRKHRVKLWTMKVANEILIADIPSKWTVKTVIRGIILMMKMDREISQFFRFGSEHFVNTKLQFKGKYRIFVKFYKCNCATLIQI